MQVRLLARADGARYWTLRQGSIEGPSFGIEPQVLREVESGPERMAALLAGYDAEGTRVWGVFDREALVAAAALTRKCSVGHGSIGVLWGVFVLPRYRGTPASRLLMDAVAEDRCGDGSVRLLLAPCTHGNVAGRRFLQRFGFEAVTDETYREAAGARESDEMYLRRVE